MRFNIKSPGCTSSAENKFWILAKGENAGRPEYIERPNSFIVECPDKDTESRIYSIAYALYVTGQFKALHIGSVVPFLRVGCIKKILVETVAKYPIDQLLDDLMVKLVNCHFQQEHLLKQVGKLKQLEEAIAAEIIKGRRSL
jgi:hypothetical protein